LSILNMRKVHGAFAAVSDIKKSALVTDKIYNKLSPYLRVN
jgi:DNA uptake protein ComE-like DNA-binding protein